MKEFLLQALDSPLGVVITTDNPDILKQRLYAAKREVPGLFDDLSFCTSRTNPETELWIVKRRESPDA